MVMLPFLEVGGFSEIRKTWGCADHGGEVRLESDFLLVKCLSNAGKVSLAEIEGQQFGEGLWEGRGALNRLQQQRSGFGRLIFAKVTGQAHFHRRIVEPNVGFL